MQPAGDHEVQNEPEIAFDADGDSLSDSAQFANCAALCERERRLRGAKQKEACEADAFEALADDARFECADVRRDVRKLRHAYQDAALACEIATVVARFRISWRRAQHAAPEFGQTTAQASSAARFPPPHIPGTGYGP